jgi:hypothetical protein
MFICDHVESSILCSYIFSFIIGSVPCCGRVRSGAFDPAAEGVNWVRGPKASVACVLPKILPARDEVLLEEHWGGAFLVSALGAIKAYFVGADVILICIACAVIVTYHPARINF